MKQPIQNYFRLGTLQWMSYPKTAPMEGLRKIVRDEFFNVIETKGYGADDASAAALLAQSGLGVCFAAQPHQLAGGINPNAVDETERAAAETALLALLDEAEALGAEGFALLAGKWQEETKEIAFTQLLKTVGALCAAAQEKGMCVELEVFDYDVDKAVLIGPAPLAARFAAEVRKSYDNFGLLVDLSHIPICHEGIEYAVRTLAPYATHFHYGNAVMTPGAPSYGDKHPRFGFPNSVNGTAELTEFLRVLRREGFFRPDAPYILSMEVTPQPGEDEDAVIAGTKRALMRAWAALEDEDT